MGSFTDQLRKRPMRGFRVPSKGRVCAEFFDVLYGTGDDDSTWRSVQRSPLLSHWIGQKPNGERYSYAAETDGTPLDAGYWNRFEAGGAQAHWSADYGDEPGVGL